MPLSKFDTQQKIGSENENVCSIVIFFKPNPKKDETFYCAGNGGNKIYVFPDQPLVIVITATAYGAPYAHSQEDKMMTEYILPAVLNMNR